MKQQMIDSFASLSFDELDAVTGGAGAIPVILRDWEHEEKNLDPYNPYEPVSDTWFDSIDTLQGEPTDWGSNDPSFDGAGEW